MEQQKRAHVIVISTKGNSLLNATLCANMAVELAEENIKTAIFDDADEKEILQNFFQKRKDFEQSSQAEVLIPDYFSSADEGGLPSSMLSGYEVVIIPSYGGKNDFKSEFFFADTLITILDEKTSLSLLSEPSSSPNKLLGPSAYTNFVWEIKKHLAATQKKSLNWAVLPFQCAETVEKQHTFLEKISKEYGFRISPSLKPRDCIQSLFFEGITLFDFKKPKLKGKMTISDLCAKREYRKFAEFVLNNEQ